MTVLFVILTFAVFITIDYFMNRGRVAVPAPAKPQLSPQLGPPDIVAGFQVPAHLRYHAGHTWLLKERKNVHRVGADEFAAILAGPIDRIETTRPGRWVRQGEKVAALYRGAEKIELVSPVEGEVTEVNNQLLDHPELLRNDPYGRGWLMTVFSPDEESPSRNLLPSALIRSWMAEAAEGFFRLQPGVAGATAADGGRPLKDATAQLPPEAWKKAARDFLLN